MGNRQAKSQKIPEFTTFTGLYDSCTWDPETVRNLIITDQLAPICPGAGVASQEDCSICFLVLQLFVNFVNSLASKAYPEKIGFNITDCCTQPLCTGD
jgi:hypothetical protein